MIDKRRLAAVACALATLWQALLAQAALADDYLWTRYTTEGRNLVKQHKYGLADKCFRAALTRAKQLDPKDGVIRDTYHDLAMLRYDQGRYQEAEPFFKNGIASYESYVKQLGKDANAKKQCLVALREQVKEMSTLADCYRAEGKYKLADVLYRSAMKDMEQWGQQDTVLYASMLSELADVLSMQKKYTEAEALYKQCQPILEHHNALEYLVDLYQDYDALLRVTNRNDEAEAMEKKIEKARQLEHRASLE